MHHALTQHWKNINHGERLFLHDKFLLNENSSAEKKLKYSSWQVFKDLMLVFLILVSIAYGLKFTEMSVNSKKDQGTIPRVIRQNTETVWDEIKKNVDLFPVAYAATGEWAGEFDSQSNTIVNIKPGKSFTYTIRFKNIGTEDWENNGTMAVGVSLFGQNSLVYDQSWVNKNTPCMMSESMVRPGQTGTFKFILHASQSLGLSEERFVISAGGSTIVLGTKFSIPFNVTNNTNADIPKNIVTVEKPKITSSGSLSSQETEDTSESLNQETQIQTSVSQEVVPQTEGDAPNNDESPVEENQLGYVENINISEPQNVRVGLFYTEKPIKVTANKSFYIRDGFGQIIERLASGQVVTVEFAKSNKQYYISVPGKNRISLSYLKFTSDEPNLILTIVSLNNIPSWNSSINFNQFRNSLEVRYAANTDRLWVINELPMEQYIAGIAETSNVSHVEFHKTMAVAARSYAMYHYNRGTKHATENFTVDATYDQVYKGYTSESIMPRYAQAVIETAGRVVTYNSETVITPYFSQSDGRTRSFDEVWYGSYPWLVSVSVPQDAGKALLGHGVGLSAWGALRMATYENQTYDQILRYFYTGTQIEKIY